MGFLDFAKNRQEGDDEYIEVGSEAYMSSDFEAGDKVKVRIFTLEKFDDVRDVIEAYKKGNTVCIVNIGTLVDLEFGEPHIAVKKMKQAVASQNGDIAAIKGNWIVLTPSFAKIFRREDSGLKEIISKEMK